MSPLVSSEAVCSHKGAHVTKKVVKLTGCSVTWKNAECCTRSKCFNAVFLIAHSS